MLQLGFLFSFVLPWGRFLVLDLFAIGILDDLAFGLSFRVWVFRIEVEWWDWFC